jgi:hypothetical protein
MSIARIHTVKAARKDQGTCDKCGTPLPAGSAYRWYTVGFRSHFKRRRCMDPACTPRASELESSLVASIYAAQEQAEDDINAAGTPDDIQSAIESVVEAVREVAEQYREAAVNPNTGATFNYESEERADTLDASADELEGYDIEADEGCSECEGEGEIDCIDCSGSGQVDDENDPESEEQVDCAECSGIGTIDCEECDGTGEANLDEAKANAIEAINGIEV